MKYRRFISPVWSIYYVSMIQWHCPVCLFDLLPPCDDHSYEDSSLSDVSLCGQSVHLESVMK